MDTTILSTRPSITRSLSLLPKWMRTLIANALLNSSSTSEISKSQLTEYLQPGWFVHDDTNNLPPHLHPESMIAVTSYPQQPSAQNKKQTIQIFGRYKDLYLDAISQFEWECVHRFGIECHRKQSETPLRYTIRIATLLGVTKPSVRTLGERVEHALYGYEEPDASDWNQCEQTLSEAIKEVAECEKELQKKRTIIATKRKLKHIER